MANCKPKKGNKFTLKEYRKNEDVNYHTENVVELVKKFGTKTDLKTILAIQHRHLTSGRGIVQPDYKKRYELHSKYFRCFFKNPR
jgi:protein-disulfide isomerase-like protein with CxxC motif